MIYVKEIQIRMPISWHPSLLYVLVNGKQELKGPNIVFGGFKPIKHQDQTIDVSLAKQGVMRNGQL